MHKTTNDDEYLINIEKQTHKDRQRHSYLVLFVIVVLIIGYVFILRLDSSKEETTFERDQRLQECASVSNTAPTYQTRVDGDMQGICRGFSKEEINEAMRSL